MYRPPHFAEDDPVALRALLAAAPLATLVTVVDGAPAVEHLPLLVVDRADGGLALCGHVARANDLWRRAGAGIEAVAVHHGPQAYVSPAWYPSKAAHGRVVPTWNYAVVHAHGCLRAIEDRDWLAAHVAALTTVHEAGRTAPWAVGDAPAAFIERLLGAIVGVELAVTRLEGKYKLSQNRDRDDRAGVAAGLATEAGGAALAALMCTATE
ncbi:MAG: FMN-binding negative transcriptional regulator [Gammaproteobacteria bacterium]|nr:FMN-binding negative transcriptional regulator [Gammaproteobacteria bacterium]MCP5198701.1 FMN-binding negative transcriptional regulator [Gammaproteobacteria bacterium]